MRVRGAPWSPRPGEEPPGAVPGTAQRRRPPFLEPGELAARIRRMAGPPLGEWRGGSGAREERGGHPSLPLHRGRGRRRPWAVPLSPQWVPSPVLPGSLLRWPPGTHTCQLPPGQEPSRAAAGGDTGGRGRDGRTWGGSSERPAEGAQRGRRELPTPAAARGSGGQRRGRQAGGGCLGPRHAAVKAARRHFLPFPPARLAFPRTARWMCFNRFRADKTLFIFGC